ncbi:MJ0042-type zinc finger domain-containing protein [Brevundimonas sp.]|uniref:MJ0042-type zinc finger domain-containing protein n=1 Tax=Brevundimonas sp. TaxID=1871086 RepID=UPI002FC6E21A
MILTCPACATSYFVSDAAIGPSGRRVRCKACGNDWRALPEDAPLELDEGVAQSPAPSPSKPAAAIEETTDDDVTTAPLTQAFRARAEQKRRTRQAVRQGLAWGLMIVLMLLGFLAAYVWRDAIVARVPKLASAYQLVGIETNPVGLDFEAITTGFARNDISQIYVSGALRNLRDREIVAPPIRIALLDRTGREYDHHILRLEGAPVLPGGVRGFAVILPNADGRFAETRLRLVADEASEKPPARPAAAPARKTAPEKAAAESPTSIPAGKTAAAADTDGLRRISQLAPSSAIGRSDLDIGPFEGVSAGNG